MKKVFGLILISIYSLLFFVVLTIFSQNDLYNIYSRFGFNQTFDNLSVYFNEPIQEVEKLEIIRIVDEIVNYTDVAIIISDYIDEENQLVGIKNYVSAKDNFITEMLPKNTEIDKEFYKGNKYVSNDFQEDENKTKLFTFYNGLTYEVIPFHYLENNLDAIKYNLDFHFDTKEKKVIEDLINKEFSNFDISISTLSNAVYDRNEELEKSIQYISVIAFIVFILFILFTISYNIRDIAILKLNGFKIKDIMAYTFKTEVTYSVILAILIPILLSILVFSTYSSRLLEFNFINIMVGYVLVTIFIGLIFLSTIVLSKYRLSDFVKNKNINSSLTSTTYVLLILSTMIILPMFQQPMNELFDTIQVYTKMKMNSYKIEHVSDIKLNQENRAWEFDQFAQLNNEANENNQRQINLYDNLEELDSIYHFRQTVLSPENNDFENHTDNLYLAYTINEKYFAESNFSIDDVKIEIEDTNRLNILMDAQTFESHNWQKNDFIGNEVEAAIYLFDSSEYLNFENEMIDGYTNKEAPIFLYTTNESLFMKNISDGGFYIDGRNMSEIEKYISEKNLEKDVAFSNLNNRNIIYTNALLSTLRDKGIEVFPSIISLCAVFISFTNFHSLEKKREIKILKSLGYKTLVISKKYIGEVLMVNFVFVLYVLLFRNDIDLSLTLYLFNLSISMILFYIYKIRRAQIKKI